MRGCSAFCRGFGAAAAAAAAAALLLCPLTVVNTEEPATAPSISPHESVPHAAPQPHQEDPVEPQEDLSSEQLDAILEGIQTFRPGAKPLSRGKGYDAASPLEATTPQKNLQRLEESLGASWFADPLRERGQEACMRLREQSEDCPSAAAAAGVAALNCNMAEVSVAKEAAVQLEESLVGSSGEDRLRCSRLFTRLLLYIDLMVFYQPFKAFQEGKSAKDALQEAFVHWGFRGDNQDDGTLATPPEVVAETSLLQARQACAVPFSMHSPRSPIQTLNPGSRSRVPLSLKDSYIETEKAVLRRGRT
ncbi:hypothetical protein, conserved [Eimeria maxima]|uniref:Transmembrane protein n=1 Tax=Eimeria maxima TaxID=5804 RepID=U6MDC8_EIMMA|nr:hypothetical protein, conserved [Eimeria maxima]CDJ61038.1 hypothetical protein, conserved [Eimeria maxima]